MSRSKSWCFTCYDVDAEPFRNYKDRYSYLVFGRETCPNTGRRHLQGFVSFKVRTKFSTVRNWLPGAHIVCAKGSPVEASEYFKKDGDYTEYGELPKIVGSADKFKDAIRLAEAGKIGDVAENFPALFLRYKRSLETCTKFTIDELEDSCGIWICGPPRCGKDYVVRKFKSLYCKMHNKWWDRYSDERNVLISDFDKSCSWMGTYLKIWTDRYAFNVEVKGGTILIRPRRVFITSNYSMNELFEGNVLHALEARFNVYDFLGNQFVLRKRMPVHVRHTVLNKLRMFENVSQEDVVVDEVDTPSVSSRYGSSAENMAKKKKESAATLTGSWESDEDDFEK